MAIIYLSICRGSLKAFDSMFHPSIESVLNFSMGELNSYVHTKWKSVICLDTTVPNLFFCKNVFFSEATADLPFW